MTSALSTEQRHRCRLPYSEEGPVCLCHEKMGNDFWFLPIDRCLYEDADEAGIAKATGAT